MTLRRELGARLLGGALNLGSSSETRAPATSMSQVGGSGMVITVAEKVSDQTFGPSGKIEPKRGMGRRRAEVLGGREGLVGADSKSAGRPIAAAREL